MLADWVAACTGRDPAAPVRGRYASEAELKALAGPGGLPRLFDRLLRAAGLRRTRDPRPGDVAIVTLAGGAPRGALRTERGFVFAAPEGVSSVPPGAVRVIMGWTMHA